MTLPVKQEGGVELMLGTTSLEMIRGKLIHNIYDNPALSHKQRRRIIKELDFLIANERNRRARLATYQCRMEELDHRLLVAQKQADIFQTYADVISKVRLLRAKTSREVARYERLNQLGRIDVIEQLLQLKARFKPVDRKDEHLKELLRIKKQRKLSEAREQSLLDFITKRAMNRASFTKMVNEKFPDMADELIDFYDQQIFQQGDRR